MFGDLFANEEYEASQREQVVHRAAAAPSPAITTSSCCTTTAAARASSSVSEYGAEEFWHQRWSGHDQAYEWFTVGAAKIWPVLQPVVESLGLTRWRGGRSGGGGGGGGGGSENRDGHSEPRAIELGAGLSRLSIDLAVHHGVRGIVITDVVPHAVETLRQLAAEAVAAAASSAKAAAVTAAVGAAGGGGADDDGSSGDDDPDTFHSLSFAVVRQQLPTLCLHGSGSIDLRLASVERCPSHQSQEDATRTSFADGSFALVIDKGVADTFALSDDAGTLGRYLAEVVRLLRVGGVFAVVTAWTAERRAQRLGPPLPLKLVPRC
jgi:hypothetical protein